MNEEFKDVVEETNENVEAQTTEEIEEGIELTDTADVEEEADNSESTEEKEEDSKPKGKFYTDEEINDLLDRRVARKMRKFERDNVNNMYAYKDTENVLKSALGASDIKEANQKLREYYEQEGIKLPEPYKPGLTSRQIEVLARDDANIFIEEGYDAMVEEANRLADIGNQNWNESERIIFNTLVEKINEEKNKKSLKEIGASEAILSDEKFNLFRKKFNSNVPIKEIYEMYSKNKAKKKFENPGSMKNEKVKQPKTIFTDEDIAKMTDEELEENWEAIRKYQTSGVHK